MQVLKICLKRRRKVCPLADNRAVPQDAGVRLRLILVGGESVCARGTENCEWAADSRLGQTLRLASHQHRISNACYTLTNRTEFVQNRFCRDFRHISGSKSRPHQCK